jgi:hypothetical protein
MTCGRVAIPALVLALTLPGAARGGPPPGQPIRDAVARLATIVPDDAGAAEAQRPPVQGAQPPRPRSRGVTRKILGGVAGGVGGMFLGGYLGAKIEGDGCNCDDPGFQGFVIGLPIGAGVGAFLGATWL